MKEFIEYNYDLVCNDLKALDDLLYFTYADKYYIISAFDRDAVEFEKIINFLIVNNIKFLNIIINKSGKYISEFNGKQYVILISNENNIVMDFPMNNYVLLDMKNSWGDMWASRVLQLEKQKNELKLSKDVYYILNYYIGLIEICLFNYNFIIKRFGEISKSCIQHNRIRVPLYSFSYYNPVNFLFDYSFRDLAEYIKICFFNEEFSIGDAAKIVNSYSFDDFSANMFLVRMLYPTYFLEEYDCQSKDSIYLTSFSKIIKKSSQYENFLLDLINIMSKNYNIVVKFPFIYLR